MSKEDRQKLVDKTLAQMAQTGFEPGKEAATNRTLSQMEATGFTPAPQPDYEGYLDNIWKATKAGGAGVYAGLANWYKGGDNDLARYLNDVVASNQRARQYDDWSLDYITDPSGLAYDFGNLLGSQLALAPAYILPGGGLAANGARLATARLLGSGLARSAAGAIGKEAALGRALNAATTEAGKQAIGRYARYAATSAPVESLSEGGHAIRDAKAEGQDTLDAYLTGAETTAKNLPLLLGSNLLEAGLVGRAFTRLGAKPGESLATRVLKAPFRATPYAVAVGAQQGLEEVGQEIAQEEALGKPSGHLFAPWTWTDQEKQVFHDTALAGGLLGGAGSVRGSFRAPEERNNNLPTGTLATGNNSLNGFDSTHITKWESKPGATDLENVHDDVKAAFNGVMSEYGDNVILTGGAEKGYHEAGANGHEGGWKLDVDKASVKDPDKFLRLCAKYGFAVGDEGDHYDLSGHAEGWTGGLRVISPENFISDGGRTAQGGSGQGSFKSSGNEEYDAFIQSAASKYGVPANILSSLLEVESGYNPNAVSKAGAIGIAQFMPDTAESYGIDPTDPAQAIEGAAHYLSDLYQQFGDWHTALRAYNGGPGGINLAETADYADKVLAGAGTISTDSKTSTVDIPKPNNYDDEAASDNLYEEFANYWKQTATGENVNFFEGFFNEKGKFQDTPENRQLLDEAIAQQPALLDEFNQWKAAQQQSQQQNAPKQSQAKPAQNAPQIDIETASLDDLKDALRQRAQTAIQEGDFATMTAINTAFQTNDTAGIRNLARQLLPQQQATPQQTQTQPAPQQSQGNQPTQPTWDEAHHRGMFNASTNFARLLAQSKDPEIAKQYRSMFNENGEFIEENYAKLVNDPEFHDYIVAEAKAVLQYLRHAGLTDDADYAESLIQNGNLDDIITAIHSGNPLLTDDEIRQNQPYIDELTQKIQSHKQGAKSAQSEPIALPPGQDILTLLPAGQQQPTPQQTALNALRQLNAENAANAQANAQVGSELDAANNSLANANQQTLQQNGLAQGNVGQAQPAQVTKGRATPYHVQVQGVSTTTLDRVTNKYKIVGYYHNGQNATVYFDSQEDSQNFAQAYANGELNNTEGQATPTAQPQQQEPESQAQEALAQNQETQKAPQQKAPGYPQNVNEQEIYNTAMAPLADTKEGREKQGKALNLVAKATGTTKPKGITYKELSEGNPKAIAKMQETLKAAGVEPTGEFGFAASQQAIAKATGEGQETTQPTQKSPEQSAEQENHAQEGSNEQEATQQKNVEEQAPQTEKTANYERFKAKYKNGEVTIRLVPSKYYTNGNTNATVKLTWDKVKEILNAKVSNDEMNSILSPYIKKLGLDLEQKDYYGGHAYSPSLYETLRSLKGKVDAAIRLQERTPEIQERMRKLIEDRDIEELVSTLSVNDNTVSIKAFSDITGVKLSPTMKTRMEQVKAYFGEDYTKWEEEKQKAAEEKERQKAEEKAREKQEKVEQAEKKYRDGESISGDDFLLLCEKYGVSVPISTKGILKNKISGINKEGDIYGSVKKYPEGVGKVYKALNKAMNVKRKPTWWDRMYEIDLETNAQKDLQELESLLERVKELKAEINANGNESKQSIQNKQNAIENRTQIINSYIKELEIYGDNLIENTTPTEQKEEAQTEQPTNKRSEIFGATQEEADREMLEALGLSEEEIAENDEEITFTDEFGDTTDEEIEQLKEKLRHKLSRVSAMPMFDPEIYTLGLQLGGKYIQKGYRAFKKWFAKMRNDLGENIEPWAPAIWETLKTYPKGEKFDAKQVMAISKAIGIRYENGTTSLDDMQAEMKKIFKGRHKTFAPMIEASYNGIKKFFDELEAARNGNDGGYGQADQGREERAEENPQGTEAVSERGSNRTESLSERVSPDKTADRRVETPSPQNADEVTENGNTEGVRSGVPGETGRQTDATSGRGMESGGRERGSEPVSPSVGRGGQRDGGRGSNREGEGRGSVSASNERANDGREETGVRETDRGEVVIPNTENYHIDDPNALFGGTPKVRFARNRKAIETFQEVQAANREPTQEEKDAMAAFTGWGSFGQQLFQGTWDNPQPAKGWEKESEWLRDTLGKEDWESARKSIINAHYTSPPIVQAMWDMVRRMGFKGGRVLEPSMGVGNFFGLMPKDLAANSKLFGVEMDTVTGGMAKMLYPKANIQITPYQDNHVADGTYDLVIGNVPFGDIAPADRRYDKFRANLHDYFFLKGIDELRPGGIMIAITSKGTMDKKNRGVRIELARKAELIDAYRFPTGAFGEYAGTDVVTDVLIFKKREQPVMDISGEEWIGTTEHDSGVPKKDKNGNYLGGNYLYNVNNFFENHPNKVLGQIGFGRASGKSMGLAVTMDKENFSKQLGNMIKSVPENAYEEAHYDKNLHYVSNNTKDRLGTLQVVNGKLYVANGIDSKPISNADEWSFSKSLSTKTIQTRVEELKDLVKLREALNKLEDAEKNEAPNLEKLRKELKAIYDAHVAKYCYDQNGKPLTVTYTTYEDGKKVSKKRPKLLEDTTGLKQFKKANEPNYFAIAALQRKDGKPAKILTERVMRTAKKDIKNPTVKEALMLQRNQSMRIDVGEIAKLAKKTEAEVLEELKGYLFKTPNGDYQVADQYLSGNVRRKMREARTAYLNGDQSMKQNIEALQKVMPEDIPYYNITVGFGGTWIDMPYYNQFVAELAGAQDLDKVKITRDKNGSWKVKFEDTSLNSTAAATTTYGLPDVKFDRLLTHALNNTKPVITKTDSETGEKYRDEEAMKKAIEQIAKIKETFADWVWQDEKRKIELAHNYNEVMNNTATPTYDGSFLDMVGMMLTKGDKEFNLRQHQINAIYRGLVNGSGIYAHEVGTGKTYTMGGLAMESRRFGIAKKPLILAHNANSRSVAKEIQEMYPGAKVLYISGNSKDVRRDLMRVKMDDWDVVVMPHSRTNMLTLTEETLKAMSADIIAELEDDAISAAKEEDNVELSADDLRDEEYIRKKVRSQTAKELAKQIIKVEETIRKNAYKASDANAIPFEELGIDMVIVDESHVYKKPPFSTKMNVKGLQKSTSDKGIQLQFLTQYIQGLNNGKGVHLFTGTPITNTVVEMYHNMKYVMPNEMKEAGIYNFDAWFNAFAQITSNLEYTSTGETDVVDRLNSFVNVPELRRMVGQYMDIVYADDMPEFEPRKTTSGKTLADKDLTEEERDYLINGRDENAVGRPYMQTINEVIPMNEAQKGILSMFMDYARQWKNATKKDRKKIMVEQLPQTPLYTENSVHKAAMDARLYDPNANVAGMDSKEARVIKNVLQVYNSDPRTTQVIMMDTGKDDSSKRIPRDERGYPVGGRTESGAFIKEKEDTFNLQQSIKEGLIAQGIPESEIAEVTRLTTSEKKAEIAAAVDRGEIRVVIGGTSTLGTGVNMQSNLKAIHHIDAPWMPGDLEQRNGRILRQGNKWNTVLEYRYITEKLDGRRWQILAMKQKFIKMFMKADENLRVLDGDAVDMSSENEASGDFEKSLAEATGDPRFLRKAMLEETVKKLEKSKASFVAGIEAAKYKLDKLKNGGVDTLRENVNKLKSIKDKYARYKRTHTTPDSFEITIGGKQYNKRADADEAINKVFDGKDQIDKEFKLGEFAGLTLYGIKQSGTDYTGMTRRYIRITDGEKTIRGFDCSNSTQGITQKLANIDRAIDTEQKKLDMAENDVKTLEKQVKGKFPREDVLNAKQKELAALNKDLLDNPVPPPQWLVEGAPMGIDVRVGSEQVTVEGYKATPEGNFYVRVREKGDNKVQTIPWQNVADLQGLPMITAPEGVQKAEAIHEVIYDKDASEATEGANTQTTKGEQSTPTPKAEENQSFSEYMKSLIEKAVASVKGLKTTARPKDKKVARKDYDDIEALLEKAGIDVHRLPLITADGKAKADSIYGAAIFINSKLGKDNAREVPIHEYTHIWDFYLQAKQPELWARGVALMKRLPIWQAIKESPRYQRQRYGLSGADLENNIATECHAYLTGVHGNEILAKLEDEASKSVVKKLKQWLKDCWKTIKSALDPWTSQEIQEMSLDDFINMPLADLAKSTPIGKYFKEEAERNNEERKRLEEVRKTAALKYHEELNARLKPYGARIDANGEPAYMKQYPTLEEQKLVNDNIKEIYGIIDEYVARYEANPDEIVAPEETSSSAKFSIDGQQGAFSIAENGAVEVSEDVETNVKTALDNYAKMLGGKYNKATGQYEFGDDATGERFQKIANALWHAYDPLNAAKYSITAWHGTPHNFERFSLQAIGTGEGAQVHGWGLYFAGSKDIAESRYRDRLTTGAMSEGEVFNEAVWVNGERYELTNEGWLAVDDEDAYILDGNEPLAIALDEFSERTTEDAVTALREEIADNEEYGGERPTEALEEAIEILENEKLESAPYGRLFQVEIPDADVLLDEDSPFEEQPEKVRKSLEEVANDLPVAGKLALADGKYHAEEVLLRKYQSYKDEVDVLNEAIKNPDEAYDIIDNFYDDAEYAKSLAANKDKLKAERDALQERVLRLQKDVETALRNIKPTASDVFKKMTGREIYEAISRCYHRDIHVGSLKASELLNKHGIEGITYIGGRDGRCYVVFDDQAIDIVAKFSADAENARKLLKAFAFADPTKLNKEQARLEQMGEEMGVTTVWFDGDPKLNGFHSKDVTFLNRKGHAKPLDTFWHESYHWIKANNRGLAQELVDAVQEAGIITPQQIKRWQDNKNRHNLSDAETIEEIIADEFINPAKFHDLANKINKSNPNLVQRLVAWIKKLADRFIEMFQGSKLGVKFSEANNALAIEDRVLTTAQRDNLIKAVGRLAGQIKDANGRNVFKVEQGGKVIRLADGKALPGVATDNVGTYDAANDDIRFSADLSENVASKELYTVGTDDDLENDIITNWEPRNDVSYRFYRTTSPMSHNGNGYAMFADCDDTSDIDNLAMYGHQAYHVLHKDLTDVEEVQELVRQHIKNIKEREETDDDFYDRDEVIEEYFRDDDGEIDLDKAEALIEELNPEDIVNSAMFFDNEDLVSWLYENIIEPNEIAGIRTADGAIVFDPSIIEPDFEASVIGAQIGTKILPPQKNVVSKATNSRKYSIRDQSPIEKGKGKNDNKGRKFSIHASDEELVKTHDDWRTNKIHIENGAPTIELLYEPQLHESSEETYRRRMMEVQRIDAQFDKGVSKSPYINFLGEHGRANIEARFARGERLADIVKDLQAWFKDALYTNNHQDEGRVILRMLALKGGVEHAQEYDLRHDNAGRNRQGVNGAVQGQGNNATPGDRTDGQRIPRDLRNRIREISRSEEDGFSHARTIAELKAEAKEAFPNAKITERGNNLIMTMPNGQKVTVTLSENITATEEELADAREAHGISQGASVTIEGYAETVNGEGFINLSQGSRKGTGFHEAYHIAEAMAFTQKELADAKRLISANDEVRADKYAEWVNNRKKNSNFAKLWRKIQDTAAKLAKMLGVETQHNLFRQVESGAIYERENQGRDTGRRYSANSTDESVMQRIKNILSGTPSNDYSHRRMMAETLGKALGLTIRSGKIADANGNVVYKESDRVLRTKHAYDWENLLPVASGIIAERLGIANKHDQTPAAMRNYITNWILTGNPNDNSQEAKTFRQAMQRNPHMNNALQEVRRSFDEWNNMSAHDQMADSVQMTKNHKTNWKELRDYTYDQMVEVLGPVERLVQDVQGELKKKGIELPDVINPMIAFRLSRGSHGRAITMIEGRGEAAVNALKKNFPAVDFTGFKTLHDILQSIDAFQNIKKQREFVTYCIAKHVLDMHAKNEQTTKEIDRLIRQMQNTQDAKAKRQIQANIDSLQEEMFTIADEWSKANCEAEVRRGEAKFGQAQKDLVRFSNVSAAILKESGVISRKRHLEFTQTWPNYVPLFRVFEDNEDIDFGDSMKHIKGSLRDIVNPLESIIKNTTEFVTKAENNKARCLLADLARCDGSGMLIEEVDTNKPHDKTLITFYENGERKYLQTDPEVVKAVNRMNADNSNAVLRVLHGITSWARACFTIASPEFAVRNIFRDYQDAVIYNKHGAMSKEGIMFSPRDMLRGAMHAIRRDETYYEWLSSGAAISSAVSLDRNYTQEMINKLGRNWKTRLANREFFSLIKESLQKLSEYSEYATRIGMYERTKKYRTKGDTQRAAYEAMVSAAFESRDLMDFARHGKGGKFWNQIVPFANASLQGIDKFYREVLDPKGWRENPKRMTRALAAAVFSGVLPALILAALFDDDDKYKNAPDWLKETHWLIPLPSDDLPMLRIPKGNDVAIRFLSNFIEKSLDEKDNKLKDFLMPLWNTLPDFAPIALLPIFETMVNKSLFTGLPIVPRSQENLPDKMQYGPFSTGMSKVLGEAFDISPRKIDHIIAGYGGSVAMFPFKAFDTLAGDRQLDTALEEMPLTRAITYMPYKNPQVVQDFYEKFDEQNKLRNEYKMTGKKPQGLDLGLYERLKTTRKRINDLNKKEKGLIDNPNITPSERRNKQMEIQKQRIAAARKVLGRN